MLYKLTLNTSILRSIRSPILHNAAEPGRSGIYYKSTHVSRRTVCRAFDYSYHCLTHCLVTCTLWMSPNLTTQSVQDRYRCSIESSFDTCLGSNLVYFIYLFTRRGSKNDRTISIKNKKIIF